MFARHASRLSLLIILTAGCSHSAPPPIVRDAPAAPAPPAPALANVTPPAATEPSPEDVLAAKVESYRKDVEAQLNRPPAPVDNTPMFANAIPLTPYVPLANPTTQPAAAIDPDMPQIIPESADRQQAAMAATDIQTPDQAQPKLTAAVRDDPKDLESQLNYEMLLFAQGQAVPNMPALAGMAAEDREILSTLMDGLSNFRSANRGDDNLMVSAKIKPLLEMGDRLAAQAELSLPKTVICSEVRGYGVYKAIEPARFVAGRDATVYVYTEVNNFSSRLTADNQWQTQLSVEMALYTETGLQVWPARSDASPVVDLCRQRRHDFFIYQPLALPHNLSIGRYLLKTTVTDQQANKVAEASTTLDVVAE